MKLFFLFLLLGTSYAATGTTVASSESTVGSSDTTVGPIVSSTVSGTGSTGAAVSTVAGSTIATSDSTVTGVSGGSTVAVSTVAPTAAPLVLSTFAISNDVTYKDAQLILQQATLLNNQIASLNAQILQAQKDTDPQNSPFFPQLAAISANLTASNATLQSQAASLQSLQSQQEAIDQRVSDASATYLCFATSSCVTDIPTTPEPTTPGPTRPPTSCTQPNVTATQGTSGTVTLPASYNTGCQFVINAAVSTDSIQLTVTVNIVGSGYLDVTETRTGITTRFNQTTTSAPVNVTTSATIKYFADASSSISYSIQYLELSTCSLKCQNGGSCLISQSGAQYCQCVACQFTGDLCEESINPCKTKQNKQCGGSSSTPYGVCYINSCFDSCYACECVKDSSSPQKCEQPDTPTWTTPDIPSSPTCAPTTVSIFTTTVAQASSAASTVGSGSTTVGPTGAAGSTVTSGETTAASNTGSTEPTVVSSTVGIATTSN